MLYRGRPLVTDRLLEKWDGESVYTPWGVNPTVQGLGSRIIIMIYQKPAAITGVTTIYRNILYMSCWTVA
jgi:hypothetical protein